VRTKSQARTANIVIEKKHARPKVPRVADTSTVVQGIATKKKRVRKPKEVKARIVEAATAAFTKYGFAGSRMRAIAEDAGVTIQLMTHHVKSKENLWKIVVEHLRAEFDNVHQTPPQSNDRVSAAERLRTMIEDTVHFTAAMPQLHRLMTLEASHMTPRLHYLLEAFARKPFEEFCVAIEEAQREGAVRKLNPARLRFAIVAMAAVPYSVAAEYEYLTGRNPFRKSEIDLTIELINDLVFVKKLN